MRRKDDSGAVEECDWAISRCPLNRPKPFEDFHPFGLARDKRSRGQDGEQVSATHPKWAEGSEFFGW